ncbi:transport and Golgi organization protein 1 homolog isoform X3 [Lynx canadensis]|uniref:transport and Golgi organization protein 1 homolog isoform X3 n=1 Tax=Lynx canadensis TaxID=61383 RepID=UPI0013C3EC88|nr:transport and Golgi organization protein 1 homolog isoform X3 [Lynx canadensis]XP_032450864.1 transport and Golgi organization protein 1 homolog isoform X3 [Lynx canadensis]
MALGEKVTQDNWLGARDLERAVAEQSREVAYLKCRLEVIQRQRLPEEFRRHKPMARRPDREIPPWRGGTVPAENTFPNSPLGMSSPQRSLWLRTAGPEREPEPLADPEAGVTPMSDKNKHSTKNAKKDQENAGAIFIWQCGSMGTSSVNWKILHTLPTLEATLRAPGHIHLLNLGGPGDYPKPLHLHHLGLLQIQILLP